MTDYTDDLTIAYQVDQADQGQGEGEACGRCSLLVGPSQVRLWPVQEWRQTMWSSHAEVRCCLQTIVTIYPLSRWCQSPRNKKGCPGVPSKTYTLSSTGFPCYWNPSDRSCAWCINKSAKQCGDTPYSDRCGRFCSSGQ